MLSHLLQLVEVQTEPPVLRDVHSLHQHTIYFILWTRVPLETRILRTLLLPVASLKPMTVKRLFPFYYEVLILTVLNIKRVRDRESERERERAREKEREREREYKV
jgi:hypothetical protein